MERLVYTQSCSSNCAPDPARNAGIARPALTTENTYSLHIAALLWLAVFVSPIMVKGQCYSLECNQGVELKLDENCEGSVNPYFMIANNWSCQGPMDMTYFDANGDTLGNTVDGTYIGQTLTVHVRHNWTGLECWGTVIVKDKRGPQITAPDTVLACNGDPGVASVGMATAADNCGQVTSLVYQDSVIDFGCGFNGFEGYFAPDNWTVCLTDTGDGGVDVTGAPETVLVEGASNSPLSLTPRYVTRFKIVIPAEGYVSFDWSSFGGSSFNTDAFYLTINNWCIQLTNDSIQSGSYTTGTLHPGDVLSFEQYSDGNADVVNTLISNFQFHTMAWKVVHRTWTATDEYGNSRSHTQVITIKRATADNVVFPPDYDGVQSPALPCNADSSPDATGWPLIDEDANPATTGDQYPFGNGECLLDLDYSDEAFAFCEGNELIYRIWTVSDACSGRVVVDTQLIQLQDVEAPLIECPQMPVISTDDFSCFGTINLPPPPNVSDACSSNVVVEPNWQFGSGYGPFTGIPPGNYTVTYTATDACGNTASCQTELSIQDLVAPTVICDEQTIVSLAGDGLGIVYAESLDDGTWDFCCIDKYEVKRTNDPNAFFASQLYLDCDDLGPGLMVTLKVTDCAGNYGTCDVEVIVDDQLPPAITPPADLTLDCNADLSNLSDYGEPLADDNCSFTLTETVEYDVTPCGEGSLTRTFTAIDLSGNSSSAQQVIHLVNQQPWNSNGDQIAWPPDYSLAGCNPDLQPSALPAPFDQPILFGLNGCAQVSTGWSDQLLWLAEPGCFQVLRTWKVIDECQYQPGINNNGIWEYTQKITVMDTGAPQFINPPALLSFFASGNGCTADVNLPMLQVSDCDDNPTITVNGDLGSGFFFENVPVGTYQMTCTATDACGNSASTVITVQVSDGEAPNAQCLNGLSVALSPAGEVTLFASTLNAGSTDNCTAAANLNFSFTPGTATPSLTLTCDDLGQQFITLWVSDEGGNASFCETAVLVTDPSGNCNPAPQGLTLGGNIHTPAGAPAGNVMVYLSAAGIAPAITDPVEGSYLFENLESGADFSISPAKNSAPLNGVTTFDIVKIQHHILGTDEFSQPWQYIAADVNNSGSVTMADIVAIRSLILYETSEFPNGVPSWQFVPADYVFPDPTAPFDFPKLINMNDLTADYLFADFVAIKTGDVNGNADPAE